MSLRTFLTGKGAPLALSAILGVANIVVWSGLWPSESNASLRERAQIADDFETLMPAYMANLVGAYIIGDVEPRVPLSLSYQTWIKPRSLRFPMPPEGYLEATVGNIAEFGDGVDFHGDLEGSVRRMATRVFSKTLDADEDGVVTAVESEEFFRRNRVLAGLLDRSADIDRDGYVSKSEMESKVQSIYRLR